MEAITLYELTHRVKQVLRKGFADSVWITAEITEILLNHSGHCYLQLADKKEEDDSVVATARGTIWAFTFRTLRPYFETMTGRSLAKGMKVMVNVEVVFHEVYGFSLNIRDIDPTYTIGDLERKKQEILAQLEAEGIINMNRELEFPGLPKNIAVISSPTAAGLGDFMHQMSSNPYGYKFHIKLFPAVMQGEKTAESVIAALDQIYEYEHLFDVVVIIRGGGSQTDLGCFDSYDIAANVAQFPLPVIAGIGHERDESIVDRVAHMRVKTPTAAAAFLIDAFQRQEGKLESLQSEFVGGVQELLHTQKTCQLRIVSDFKRTVQTLLAGNTTRLKLLSQCIAHTSKIYIGNRLSGFGYLKAKIENHLSLSVERQRNQLQYCSRSVQQRTERILADNQRRLELALTTVRLVDPRRVLSRGYSVTRLHGKAVTDVRVLKEGDILVTEVAKGEVKSEVKIKNEK